MNDNNRNEELDYKDDMIEFNQLSEILEWSLTILNIISNNYLIAILCVIKKDMLISNETEDMILKEIMLKQNGNDKVKDFDI